MNINNKYRIRLVKALILEAQAQGNMQIMREMIEVLKGLRNPKPFTHRDIQLPTFK